MIGKLLATPIRLANAPLRATEKMLDNVTDTKTRKRDRIASAPLESLAEAIEEAVDGEDD